MKGHRVSRGGAVKEQEYAPSVEETVVSVDPLANPSIIMENVLDKLRVLNYKQEFCGTSNFPPLSNIYFANPSKKPTEQFFYFTSLVSWLLNDMGIKFSPPSQFDDPNATCANIVQELKKIGLQSDFPSSKLKQGSGSHVCTILEALLDVVLSHRDVHFSAPVYPQEDEEEEDEGLDEDLSDMEGNDVAEEMSESDDDEDFFIEESSRNVPSERMMMEATDDPAEWKMELERIAPRLKVRLHVDVKDWRARLDQMIELKDIIEIVLPKVKGTLGNLADEITKSLDKISRREKSLNTNFQGLLEEYKASQKEIADVQQRFEENNSIVSRLTGQLADLSEEYEEVKGDMEKKNDEMINTTPLVSIKEAISKIRTEVKEMDTHVGVLRTLLLQADIEVRNRIRSAGGRRKEKGK